MTRKRAVALAIAASVSVTMTASDALAATSTSTSARPSGPQSSKAPGPVRFTSFSSNDGATSAVVITGAIGDFGHGVRTYANGTSEKQYNQLDFVLTHGSFRVSIVGLESQLVSAFNHFPSNTTTCSGIVTAIGTSPIIVGSGTGDYKGISGSFTVSITVHEVDSWSKCRALLAESIVTSGSGSVSFG
jgi:hypothetical protein